MGGLATLGRLAAPDALVVFRQCGYVGEAGILNAALGLVLGEAIGAGTGAAGLAVSVVVTAGVVELVVDEALSVAETIFSIIS